MKAVVFAGKGGSEVVGWSEIPTPRPARGEVLVRVKAAALNRADLLQRRGLYPPVPGVSDDRPGLELAGEVAEVGEDVTAWRPGDRVMAISAGEGQAEYAVVHERMLLRIPERLSYEEAGALMEAAVTSHDAMFTLGGLRPGWTILIHAVGSGVSTFALQLAKAAGATVIGTSRTAEKLARARALGLDHPILVSKDEPRFAAEVRKVAPAGVPLVLDFVGATYLGENLASLAPQGRMIEVGTMGGPKGTVDLGLVMRVRATITGTVLRPRPLEEKVAATLAFARGGLALVADGRVKAIVDSVLPMAKAREAHERMENNDSFGKLVLVP